MSVDEIKKERQNKKINELEQMIYKNVFICNKLYYVERYSTIYLYVNEYELNINLKLSDNIIFINCGEYINYYNFRNIKKPLTKIKYSSFYTYEIINNENIEDVYIITKNSTKTQIFNNYNLSEFKLFPFNIKMKQQLYIIISELCFFHLTKVDEPYYFLIRLEKLEQLNNYINIIQYNFNIGNTLKTLDELLDEIEEFKQEIHKINYKDEFYKLLDEININSVLDDEDKINNIDEHIKLKA